MSLVDDHEACINCMLLLSVMVLTRLAAEIFSQGASPDSSSVVVRCACCTLYECGSFMESTLGLSSVWKHDLRDCFSGQFWWPLRAHRMNDVNVWLTHQCSLMTPTVAMKTSQQMADRECIDNLINSHNPRLTSMNALTIYSRRIENKPRGSLTPKRQKRCTI